MEIVTRDENKDIISRTIMDALPQWFGIEAAKEAYARAARDLPMFACVAGGETVGFLSLKVHNAFAVEIQAMGVLPQWHGQGVGRQLMRSAEHFASERGLCFLTVKTLAPSNPDEHYRATRRFYRFVGFVPLEELPDLWGSDNPCLLMVKHLDGRRSNPDIF